jgi:hypothetical protein
MKENKRRNTKVLTQAFEVYDAKESSRQADKL